MAQGFNDNTSAAVIRQLFNDFVAEFNLHAANNNNPHAVTKSQVGLSDVDNTSDVNKPVSNAVAALLAGKYPNTNPSNFITVAQALAAVLTGFVSDTGTINATHTVQQAIQKLYGNALQAAIDIAARQTIEMEQLNTDVVTFLRPVMYGTYAAPRSGANVNVDFTDAKLGVKCIFLHNAGAEPTYPASFKKLNTSQPYVNGVVNFIEVQYFSNTRVTVNIYQEI